MYFTGDGARRDKDGYFWIMGRVDDVLNVSGHRLGTAEIESALVSPPRGGGSRRGRKPDPIKGSAVCAFVTLERSQAPSPDLKEQLREHVRKEIGPWRGRMKSASPEPFQKTRSGKIMRRLLREMASTGTIAGDTTTLEDFGVLESCASAKKN